MIMPVVLACLALVIEAVVGYPNQITRAIGHPVAWIGGLIAILDRTMNRDTMRPARRVAAGAAALVLVIVAAAGIAYGVELGLAQLPAAALPVGAFLAAIAASMLIAQRSLHDHVARVADALERGLAEGREAVSHIVGRDPEALDEAGVARAAIESLAENFSDGVVAPVFWLSAGGLAGGAAYKAINTADSMIGHRTPRHGAFGWAAARLDDLVNLPASRLAALLIVAAAVLPGLPELSRLSRRPGRPGDAPNKSRSQSHRRYSWRNAWRAVIRDAPNHRSPNAGYPEAAMAGALGLALAGPRVYGGIEVKDALMGNGRRTATVADIRAALALYRRADALLIGLVAVLALFVTLIAR
jgi:adenosylcobinamide-phosphate synthase